MGDTVVATRLGSLLAAAHDLVDTLQTTALDPDTDTELLEVWRELERLSRRLPTVEATLVREAEARGLPGAAGCRTTATFLRGLLRLTPHEAYARVEAADATGPRRAVTGAPLPPSYPAVAHAQAAGAISPRHAAVITTTLEKLPDISPEQSAQAERDLDPTGQGGSGVNTMHDIARHGIVRQAEPLAPGIPRRDHRRRAPPDPRRARHPPALAAVRRRRHIALVDPRTCTTLDPRRSRTARRGRAAPPSGPRRRTRTRNTPDEWTARVDPRSRDLRAHDGGQLMREHNPVQRAVLDAGRARGLAPETLATWLSVLNENALLGPDGHLAAHRVTEFLDAIAPNRGQLVRRGPTATGHDGHGRHTSTPVISDENTQPAAQWATRFGSRKPHQDDERQQQMRATVSTISPRAVQVGPRGHAEAGRRFGTPAEVRDDRNPIP